MTLTIIGFEKNPIGMKISIFDINQTKEDGIFLSINYKNWQKIIVGYKKKKKFLTVSPVEEEFNLQKVMKSVGWKLILKNLNITYNNENIPMIEGKKIINKISYVDQLENIINLNNVLQFLN